MTSSTILGRWNTLYTVLANLRLENGPNVAAIDLCSDMARAAG